jgi:hypothetical protein
VLKRLRCQARPLARIGCVSIGTVYVLVGVFALLALSGRHIESADEDRIIHVLLGVPGGAALIWGIAAGAAAYVVWRAIEALTDPYDFGSDWRGLSMRIGVALSGVGYGLIAFSAARIAVRDARASGRDAAEQEQQLLVAQALEWPAGPWIVAIIGLAVLVVGLMQFGLVYRRSYTTEIRMEPHTARGRTVIHALAGFGYSARGVILSVLGYFLLRAGLRRDPSEAGDTDTAFDFVGGGLVGDTAFAIVALGTIAYGVFMYANAWHYRFEADANRAEVNRTREPAP